MVPYLPDIAHRSNHNILLDARAAVSVHYSFVTFTFLSYKV